MADVLTRALDATIDTEYRRVTDIPPLIFLDRALPTTLTCIVAGDNGQPLKDASVELVQSAKSAWRRFAVTDVAGQAVFENVDPQPGTLIARRAGYVSTISPLAPTPGASDCTFRLSRGYRLRLTIENDGGAERETYRLRILDDRGVSIESGLDDNSPRTLRAGGEASIGVLAPGRYTVELIASRRTRRGRVTIRAADAELTIR